MREKILSLCVFSLVKLSLYIFETCLFQIIYRPSYSAYTMCWQISYKFSRLTAVSLKSSQIFRDQTQEHFTVNCTRFKRKDGIPDTNCTNRYCSMSQQQPRKTITFYLVTLHFTTTCISIICNEQEFFLVVLNPLNVQISLLKNKKISNQSNYQ